MSNNPSVRHCAVVTGATGYIGSCLVKRMVKDDWNVHVIVRPESDLSVLKPVAQSISIHVHDGSTDALIELLALIQPEIVFHLASLFLAQHQPKDIAALVGSNVYFSAQLMEAMVQNGVNYLINTGTSWQHYQDEPYRPVNLYAATKQAFEDILAYYCDAYRMKVTTLALFDTYGPNDPRKKLIALLWEVAETQEALRLSPGEQMLDMVHVEDVLEAFLTAAHLLPDQAAAHVRYGVSSGAPMRLIDLVAAFEQATGSKLPVVWSGRPYRPREVMVPWSSYASLPGWSPRVPFSIGIVQTRPPETH